MTNPSLLEKRYSQLKGNGWHWLFSIFCRCVLAFAFIVAGLVKIVGERFASGLAVEHPMGAYLEALHQTGFYYTWIGIFQVLAAVLLLIPRTVFLGALLYFPIILNICILTFAVRFEGSLLTAPLMVLANLYLLVWNYDRLQYLFPIPSHQLIPLFKKPEKYSWKFPFLFFGGVGVVMVLTLLFARFGYDVVPRNSLSHCQEQFWGTEQEQKGLVFCDCIHVHGLSLDSCLNDFELEE